MLLENIINHYVASGMDKLKMLEHLWLFKKLQHKKKNQWFNFICAMYRALQTDCSSFQHFKDAQPLSLMF